MPTFIPDRLRVDFHRHVSSINTERHSLILIPVRIKGLETEKKRLLNYSEQTWEGFCEFASLGRAARCGLSTAH